MILQEVVPGRRYKCEWADGFLYYATVLEKDDRQVLVRLEDRERADGDRDDAIHRLGTLEPQWVDPAKLYEF